MLRRPGFLQYACFTLAALLVSGLSALAASTRTATRRSTAKGTAAASRTSGRRASPRASTRTSAATPAKSSARRRTAARYRYGIPTYADSTKDDIAQFDDPVVREAAVEALGRYNGAVVAIDPNNGRVLSIVNQKLAFSEGFIPCSTIKPAIALAALEENVITRDTMVPVARRRYMNLTEAMAHSNNVYFEELGRRLGFETVERYARLLGLGELAGFGIPEEHSGEFPSAPPQRGGVARMSSFGEGIQITPLQLVSLASIIANGGTVYYLQYPRSEEERQSFAPRIKRTLSIGPLLPEIREGLLAAVLYGTARSSSGHLEEQPLGKTGTCSDRNSRLGWFVSYADQVHPRIALAVLLRGNTRSVKGPKAAEIAGRMYRILHERNFFAENRPETPGGVPATAMFTSINPSPRP